LFHADVKLNALYAPSGYMWITLPLMPYHASFTSTHNSTVYPDGLATTPDLGTIYLDYQNGFSQSAILRYLHAGGGHIVNLSPSSLQSFTRFGVSGMYYSS
jgi:hypothetical protein